MNKIFKTLLVALVAMCGFQTGAFAQDEYEYADALAAIEDGQSYRIYTEFQSKKYYLKENGTLTDVEKQAYAFTFTKVIAGGTLWETGFNLSVPFTNPSLTGGSSGDVVHNGHLNINSSNRNDWERQVLFNRNGFYAIRSTNANSANWGANTYWDVLDENADNLPEADYSLDASYVWHLEQFSDARPEAFAKMSNWAWDIQQVYGLVKDASQYISNAKDPAEGTYEALLDNKYDTFFHSTWHASADPGENHYLQAELPEAAQKFHIYFKKRSQNNNNRPTKLVISGSNDGTSFTEIKTLTKEEDDLPIDANVISYTSKLIDLGAPYKYVRFTVPETNNGGATNGFVFFTFSEFYILPSNDDTADALDIMTRATTATDLEFGDVSTINSFSAKLSAMALIAEAKEVLSLWIDRAKALINQSSAYNDPSKKATVLKKLVADVEGRTFDSPAAVDAATAEVQDGIKALLTGVEVKTSIDLTSFIVNPTPTSSSNGWVQSGGGFTYDPGQNVAEVWNGAASSIAQTIPWLPAGSFTLVAQAHTRTGMHSILAAGESQMDIVTVGSDVTNGRAASNAWFSAGNGENKLDFFVVDENAGTTISLTSDNTTGDHWTVWRGFQLAYNGNKPEAYVPTYNDLMQQAQTYMDNEGGGVTIANYVLSDLDEITTRLKAETDFNNVESLIAAITELRDINSLAEKSKVAYKVLASGLLNDDAGYSASGWVKTGKGTNFQLQSNGQTDDGSGIKAPIMENWRSYTADEPGQLDCVITYTLEGLDPGAYQVTSLVRAVNQGSDTNYPTGLYVWANKSQEDATLGTQELFDGKAAVYGTYSVIGSVKSSGKLQFGFRVENSNFNWLVWQKVIITPAQGVDVAFQAAGSDAVYFDTKKKTAIAKGDVKNVSKEINDGIIIDNSDAVVQNQSMHRAGYRTEVIIEDIDKGAGSRFQVTGDETNILAVAPGFFEPNKTYNVTINYVRFYDFETTVGDLLEDDPALYATLTAAGYDDCDIYPLQDNTIMFPMTFQIVTDNKVVATPQMCRHQIIESWGDQTEDVTTVINSLEAGKAKAPVFNLAGQRVESVQKGVYIVGGKKVVVR